MKKRIIAILLVLSVLVTSLGNSKRVSAEPVTGIVVCAAACIAAVSMLQYATSGQYEKDAENLVNFIESAGEDVNFIINGETITDENGNTYHINSNLQDGYGSYARAFESIANSIQNAINNGELVKEYVESPDGVIKEHYKIRSRNLNKLIAEANQSISVMARPNIDFTSGYNCTFLNVDLSKPFTLKSLPTMPEFFNSSNSESYAAVYFDDTRIIFSQYYIEWSPSPACWILALNENYTYELLQGGIIGGVDVQTFIESNKYSFSMETLSKFPVYNFSMGLDNFYQNPVTHCFVYENGTITYTPLAEVDVSGMNSGLVTTTGNYGDFLKTINDYSVSTTVPKLDDLSGVVPDDATLTIPLNPDKDKPIAEQIGVSIPGVVDTTLAELQGDIDIDIDVPSIIVDKFPFCIPFDFVRFLSLLCSEPVAPVFRIPLSTHPDNLEQWEGNQTIGDYIVPDSPPLFEIDEEIVIDLSVIPLLQPICYICFIVGFIFLLLHITPKMIQH